jgi:hypothetical protein
MLWIPNDFWSRLYNAEVLDSRQGFGFKMTPLSALESSKANVLDSRQGFGFQMTRLPALESSKAKALDSIQCFGFQMIFGVVCTMLKFWVPYNALDSK